MNNFIPKYWSDKMLYRFNEENKLIEKIEKTNLTKEQKAIAVLLIYNGFYKSSYFYIKGCQEIALTGKCGTYKLEVNNGYK